MRPVYINDTNIYFKTLIIFILFQFTISMLKQPPFFFSFYCNLGTKNVADSGDYSCLSPKIIARADKYAISLMQMNKVSGIPISFKAYVKSTPGTNIGSVLINLTFQSAYLTSYAYMIVVIGYDPINIWVDLVNYSLLDIPAQNNLYTAQNVAQSFSYYQDITLSTMFSSTAGLTAISFISSLSLNHISPSAVYSMTYNTSISNTTHIAILLSVIAYSALQSASGFVLLYNPTQITTDAGVYLFTNFMGGGKNYQSRLGTFGPRMNPKCIIGYNQISVSDTAAVTFSNNSDGWYSGQSASGSFQTNNFCLSDGSQQCLSATPYYDELSKLCYASGSLCPVSTPTPSPLPSTYVYSCKLCVSLECLNCTAANRNTCTNCDTTKFTILLNGACVCISGYYRPTSTSSCQTNCTYYLPNCKPANCTSSTNCNQCFNGFYLSLAGSDYQCQPCTPNCPLCVSPICTSCAAGYGVNSVGNCDSCGTLFNQCTACTNFMACTQCEINPYTFLLNSDCKNCSQFDSSCSSCQLNAGGTDLQCTSCIYPLIPNSIGQCVSCSTVIDDCEQCIYNSLTKQAKCTKCTDKFNVDSSFTCTICKKGQYVQRQCMIMSGCQSMVMINGKMLCLACDNSLYFQFDSPTFKCVCKQGFILDNQSDSCTDKCGNGIKTFNQECDDNNLINEDGCNDQCKIQSSYQCVQNLKGITLCTLVEDIFLLYDYTLKNFDGNNAELYFSISPVLSPLNKVDWQKSLQIKFLQPMKTSYYYSKGILIIKIQCPSILQDQSIDFTVNFDTSLIKSKQQKLSVKMSAVNGPLQCEDETDLLNYKIFNLAGFVLGIVCLVLFIVSTYSHKMIGLETVQFIQLIYFVRIISSGTSHSSITAFNTLKYSNGYNQVFQTSSNDQIYKSVPSTFIKLNLKLYYLENCNMMLIPIGFATLAYAVYFLRRSRAQSLFIETKQVFQKDLFLDFKRKVEWIYGHFIFSFSLSLLYLTVFQMLLYELSTFKSHSEHSKSFVSSSFGVSLLLLFYIFSIFCSQTISGIKKYIQMKDYKDNVTNQQKGLTHDGNCQNLQFHPLYVSVYLLYQFLVIVMLNLIFEKFQLLIEAMTVLSFFYLIIITIWRPYTLMIHNFAIIFNQVTMVLFVLLQLVMKYKLANSMFETIGLYLTLTLISAALIIQAIRLYIHALSLKQNVNVSQNSKENKQKKAFVNDKNPYLINNQVRKMLQNATEYEKDVFKNAYDLNRQFYVKLLKKKNLSIQIPSQKQKKINLQMKQELPIKQQLKVLIGDVKQ